MAPYVEMRMGSALPLISAFACGGLDNKYLLAYSEHYFQPFLVASWIAGLYYSLFVHKEFKIALWRIFSWKYYYVDSRLAVPITFVLSWWAYVFSNPYSLNRIFENLIPVVLFVLASAAGDFFKKKNPIPKGFLYNFEWQRWRTLTKRQNVDLKKMTKVAQFILDFNPQNIKVQYDICKRMANEFKNTDIKQKDMITFFSLQLNHLLFHLAVENRYESGIEILRVLPIKKSFKKVLVNMSSKILLAYAKYCESKKQNLLAIFLYCAYIEKRQQTKKLKEILSILDLILAKEMDLQENIDFIQELEEQITQSELKTLLKQHFQFSRTAIATAIHKKIS
ncbi:MAG: hypothetical protein KDD40_00430 [Bdellovibrionales bacterium]|nr:hypothetical protein [Bdellovibrionales bacterium]